MSDIETFIKRWNGSERAERANFPAFALELCDVLGVARPPPASGSLGDYRFERGVTRHEPDGRTSPRRIDLYKKGCFILEAKQGGAADDAGRGTQQGLFPAQETDRRAGRRKSPGWAQAMLAARGQAEAYARDLPVEEGWPPFLIVCDVGFCFDIYADFSGTGKNYAQFPDGKSFRFYLPDLKSTEILERLRAIWTNPTSLDPQARRVTVTREISAFLADLARALERRHAAETVSTFLMRAIFCMFAQSVGLLPGEDAFTRLLERCQAEPRTFVGLVGNVWQTMNSGGFCPALAADLPKFNGGLFAPGPHGSSDPLNLDADMIGLLVQAAGRDWSHVEPAIFGTLLENALDPRLRGQLGAHFTPRAFVERLVVPTIIEPLRLEWDAVVGAASERANEGNRAAAADIVRKFHGRLCSVKVLDPACGTGNFLYVTLELMKRLEGEVLDFLFSLDVGDTERFALTHATVDPHQFLGLEKNPRAVPVAELVLWIGYLQWHFRTKGAVPPSEPILRDFHNIIRADALLDYTHEEMERDSTGRPVTRWDGLSFKLHPITGEKVPDESHRIELMRPVRPKPAVWPKADFIVGNPPFIAGKDMRAELGDGYAEALWAAYPKVPKSADIALFFWWKAAQAVQAKQGARRFGLITSNSLRQVFSRRVIASVLRGKRRLRLVFAIPDHPWSAGIGSAAVRIAMSVAELAAVGPPDGLLQTVEKEEYGSDVPTVTLAGLSGIINADLTIGGDASSAFALRANQGVCSPGMKLHGSGFIVTPAQAARLGYGKIPALNGVIRPYLNGRDLTQRSRNCLIIDLYGWTEDEVRKKIPPIWQHLANTVKQQRDAIADRTTDSAQYARDWWRHGKPRPDLRAALRGLPRYIATVETAKHRVFCFLPASVLPDNMLVCIASDSAFHLGVLSSCVHQVWALVAGGRLGIGNDPRYNKTRCFDPYPFPTATATQQGTIAAIAEELDALRRKQLDANPPLTVTGIYNVLEALRAQRTLTPAERDIHDMGHVSVLLDLHTQLDREVAAAYGWRPDLSDAEIVARIVALNAERQEEEESGLVRWLRPAFQAGDVKPREQAELDVDSPEDGEAKRLPWPSNEPEQYLAVRAVLKAAPGTVKDIAQHFARARKSKLETVLRTLTALGQIHQALDGSYYL